MKKNNNTNIETQLVIYCGPNIPKYGLVQFAVYKGEMPANVKEAIAKIEEINKVMVPIPKLNAFRRELARKGSEAHRLYTQIAIDAKERD